MIILMRAYTNTQRLGKLTSQHNILTQKNYHKFCVCSWHSGRVRTLGLWILSITLYQLNHPITHNMQLDSPSPRTVSTSKSSLSTGENMRIAADGALFGGDTCLNVASLALWRRPVGNVGSRSCSLGLASEAIANATAALELMI